MQGTFPLGLQNNSSFQTSVPRMRVLTAEWKRHNNNRPYRKFFEQPVR